MVAHAIVHPMSMALGLQLLSVFLHCILVAPPWRSPPFTLFLRKMYSCWWALVDLVQSFHMTGWSNLMQFATNLNGRALWKMSNVASSSKFFPAFFAVVWNCDMNVSRSSPFILKSCMLYWALTFSAELVYDGGIWFRW